jgi:adenylate cyclase
MASHSRVNCNAASTKNCKSLTFVIWAALSKSSLAEVVKKKNRNKKRKEKKSKPKARTPPRTSSRKLAAIMFTDMVGYTALGQRNESLSLALVNEQRKLLRPLFKRHNGREIDTIGDAFLVKFESALDATRCAFDIQRAVREYNISLPEDKRFMLRVGVHLGDVIESKSGDISGDAVNVASRIEPLAEQGGVCISRQVYDHVQNKFELPLESFGFKSLKNVKNSIEVFKMVMPWEKQSEQRKAQTTELNTKQVSFENLDPKRIAILPFANLSPDPNDEYFADGMTEELISKVSLIRELSVVSRTSAMGYKNQPGKHAIDVGRELNVGTILEGSVRKAGNKVRISAQLIDVQTDRHLWAENYERDLEDVFAIQREIAESVASSLEINLLSKEKEMIGKVETSDVQAHVFYLKGCFHFNRQGTSSYLKAIELFKEATEKDPNYSLAFAKLASSYAFLGLQALRTDKEAFSKSEGYARKALELNQSLPEAHMALAFVLIYKWDLTGAEREFKQAIELNPNYATAHAYYANLLYFMRRFDECVDEVKIALELDPLSAETSNWAGTAYLYARRYDESIEQFRNALEIDPNILMARDNLGLAYIQKGMLDLGIIEIQKAVELAGESGFASVANDAGYAYSKVGRIEETRNILTKLLLLRNKDPTSLQFAIPIAGLYTTLGENDKALEWLEMAYKDYSPFLITINFDFIFDRLRTEPRFISLLKRIGL